MRILASFDEKNYENTTKVFEKYNIRGIVLIDGKMVMQRSRDGEYKIPGGGVEADESHLEALRRELREEAGLVLKGDSIKELGEITEIRQDIFKADTKYICHSLFYLCEVTEERVPTAPTESEIKKGYEPVWETPQVIYETNTKIGVDPWIKRDTAFIKMLLDGMFEREINDKK